jgi:hypothetical protein
MAATGSLEYFEWFKFQFWRFVFVQQQVMKLAETAVEYPPMQKGASFNLEAVKAESKRLVRHGQVSSRVHGWPMLATRVPDGRLLTRREATCR